MTKIYFQTAEDHRLIEKSFSNLLGLVFGTNGANKAEIFKSLFMKLVKNISVYPQGTVTEHINNSTPGICRKDPDEKELQIIIEMLGYTGASLSQYPFIQHEGTHEFCHAFADLLPLATTANPEGIIKNGIHCQCHMGMIKESDPETGELVHQHYYGKMFNETMMDIITTIAINYFDISPTSPKTVDEILEKPHTEWENTTTGYSIFTSLTRLAIAAFSNNGYANYDSVIRSGGSIFTAKTNMHDGSSRYVNDFLYGILFDPLHIEKEFDQFMGEGEYRKFCEYLDRLFIYNLKYQKIPAKDVKYVMNVLPDFLNKKINYYLANGLLTREGANKIVGNFNRIWNSMQYEFNAYFSNGEIDKIERRANS